MLVCPLPEGIYFFRNSSTPPKTWGKMCVSFWWAHVFFKWVVKNHQFHRPECRMKVEGLPSCFHCSVAGFCGIHWNQQPVCPWKWMVGRLFYLYVPFGFRPYFQGLLLASPSLHLHHDTHQDHPSMLTADSKVCKESTTFITIPKTWMIPLMVQKSGKKTTWISKTL